MAGQGNRKMLIVIVVLALLLLGALIAIGVLVHKMTLVKGITPELYYSPSVDGLIDFTQGDPSTYAQYTDRLSDDLKEYSRESQSTESFMDCSGDTSQAGPEQSCVFPLEILGPDCTPQRDFGYDEGRPCILLSLETIIGWSDHALCNETAPPEVRGKIRPGHMMVTCQGENPADMDNSGSIRVWPEGGFDLKYYPKGMQETNYRKPLVMVQFLRLRPGVLVEVTCKVWSDSIRHLGRLTDGEGGSVTFNIRID